MLTNTPAYSLHRITFFTLAGVDNAQLDGELIVGRFADSLKLFYDLKGKSLFEEFANWPSGERKVLDFTRRYGPLEEGARERGTFKFSLEQWRFSQTSFRETWEHLQPRPGVRPISGLYQDRGGHGWAYDGGRLTYRAVNLKELMLLSLWACPKERLRKCARPDCPHPYFVARHLKQNYCSEPCATWGQRQWKLKWWKEHGKEWREKHQGQKTRTRR
jgi:hypothetical protein